jgi:hypothetical protein
VRLIPQLVPQWPKLAWVATFAEESRRIRVLHGPMVEVAEDWIVEAAWAGEFTAGDFDRSDLVFGSGVRLRGDQVVFVSAASGVDRLWYCLHTGHWYVANSLPALLAVAELALRDDYPHYSRDMESVEDLGIRHYVRTIPTQSTAVAVLYFDNLVYDGLSMREVGKPGSLPHFPTFDHYFDFLKDTAARLGENLRSPGRRNPIIPLVGISSGYDSGAVAVVAQYAGCEQTVTIEQSRSLWRGSDSGAEIARRLGLACQRYNRSTKHYRREETIWAGAGLAGGLNLTYFDYPKPLSIFFGGSYGDKIWDRFHHDLSEPVGDRDHLLGEFRLIEGLFQCVVPWWGIQRAQEINALGSREEMAPWTLHTKYDRPVARRILEEAGVPRQAFGKRKKDTATNTEFLWPFSAGAQARFATYLKRRGFRAPGPRTVSLIRRLAQWENLLYLNLLCRLGLRRRFQPWRRLAGVRLTFQWANHELKTVYQAGLAERREAADGAPQDEKSLPPSERPVDAFA